MRAGCAVVVLIVLYLVLKNDAGFPMWELFLVLFPLTIIGIAFKRSDETADQRPRDRAYQEYADQQFVAWKRRRNSPFRRHRSLDGATPPDRATPGGQNHTILFIRPFQTDSELRVQNPRANSAATLIPMYRFILPYTVTLDDAVRWHTRSLGELVAVGAPGVEVTGATRTHVDQAEWHEYVMAMAESARAIILLMGARAGTVWEIEAILAAPALLAKTLFLVPPECRSKVGSPTNEISSVLLLLEAAGVRMPNKLDCGDGIAFKPDKSFRFRRPVLSGLGTPSVNRSSLIKCVKELISTKEIPPHAP
jgi:hypothetical protein